MEKLQDIEEPDLSKENLERLFLQIIENKQLRLKYKQENIDKKRHLLKSSKEKHGYK